MNEKISSFCIILSRCFVFGSAAPYDFDFRFGSKIVNLKHFTRFLGELGTPQILIKTKFISSDFQG